MLNKVFLQGRLVAAPELRHTTSGTAVASYRLAVDRSYSKDNHADFINVISWRQAAGFVTQYFGKGDMILIEGRLQSRTWEDAEGNRHYTMEVVTDSINFCGNRNRRETGASSAAPVAPAQTEEFTELMPEDGILPF